MRISRSSVAIALALAAMSGSAQAQTYSGQTYSGQAYPQSGPADSAPLVPPGQPSYGQSPYNQSPYGETPFAGQLSSPAPVALPCWWEGAGWSTAATTALRAMAAAGQHGLNPADYALPRLSALLDGAAAGGDSQAVALADAALSATVVRYLNDLYNGRIDPRMVGWNADTAPQPVEMLLADALRAGKLDTLLQGPQTPAYRALQAALASYQALSRFEWPQLPDGPSFGPGEEGRRVAILREQLALLGDLDDPTVPSAAARTPERQAKAGPRSGVLLASMETGPVSGGWRPTETGVRSALDEPSQGMPPAGRARQAATARFDDALTAAVRRFQQRHGLNPDGVVGAGTRQALNVPPKERARQIKLNLERQRWMPANLGDRHVLVNIPGFELQAVDYGQVALRMPVVVGEPEWQTPVLSDDIVNLKFAPDWTIPANIVRQETLAHVRRDPSYLRRKSIRVYRGGQEVSPDEIDWSSVSAGSGYLFRQAPGPQNALGQIRFSLTNPENIYLHDTPSTRGFSQVSRALSHGCVRVAQPEDLAMYVLGGDPSWDRKRLTTAMNGSRPSFHTLPQPVRVHLVYFTSWVDETGTVQFRPDVYKLDTKLASALDGRPRTMPFPT